MTSLSSLIVSEVRVRRSVAEGDGKGAQPCGRQGVWLATFEGAGAAGTLILRSISSTEKSCSQWRAVQWSGATRYNGAAAGCVARRRRMAIRAIPLPQSCAPASRCGGA
eukprot:scaffold108347_cov53-Phaeocystis_antarctica.AAC.1